MSTVPVYLDRQHYRDLLKLCGDEKETTHARRLLEAAIDEETGKNATEEKER